MKISKKQLASMEFVYTEIMENLKYVDNPHVRETVHNELMQLKTLQGMFERCDLAGLIISPANTKCLRFVIQSTEKRVIKGDYTTEALELRLHIRNLRMITRLLCKYADVSTCCG